jgi:hypothetical protein
MTDDRPGLNVHRLHTLMRQAIERCQLQLDGAVVFTEAASGAYIVTPILAAMAGAKRVFALTQNSRYGTIEQVKAQTYQLAEIAGINDRIEFVTEKSADIISQVDIVTNSGHVRPINAEMVSHLKSSAVIGLMYEAWEFRPDDIDIMACYQRSIPVVGVNERHSTIDVFSFLGIMAVKLLLDAGVSVYTSTVLLLCDNPFSSYIQRGLINAGADVEVVSCLSAASLTREYDAILVALHPQARSVLSEVDATMIAKYYPGAVVAQFWGDIERSAFATCGIPLYPLVEPKPGHMGILPSAVGAEPIIRLQAGGLKAAEVVWRQSWKADEQLWEFAELL